MATYQWNDHLAIRVSLVVVRMQRLPQDAVIVDFAIDGQSKGSVIVHERLSTGV